MHKQSKIARFVMFTFIILTTAFQMQKTEPGPTQLFWVLLCLLFIIIMIILELADISRRKKDKKGTNITNIA